MTDAGNGVPRSVSFTVLFAVLTLITVLVALHSVPKAVRPTTKHYETTVVTAPATSTAP